MKIINDINRGGLNKTYVLNGFCQFECTDSEKKRLLNFLVFTQGKEMSDSDFWSALLDDSFVAFSKNKISLLSGNHFGHGKEIYFWNNYYSSVFQFFYDFLRNTYNKFKNYFKHKNNGRNWFFYNKRKKIILKSLTKNELNFDENLYKLNPDRYLDYFYTLNSVEEKFNSKINLLEIGAGLSCSALILYQNKKLNKFINIDLPNQIIVSFLILSCYTDLKIALPHEVNDKNLNDYDVLLLLPDQKELIQNDTIDLAINVSSFQEMNIEVVNDYLDFIGRKLIKNKSLISVNQISSKYINNNNIKNYNLNSFRTILENENIPSEINNLFIKREPLFKRKILKLQKI